MKPSFFCKCYPFPILDMPYLPSLIFLFTRISLEHNMHFIYLCFSFYCMSPATKIQAS